MLLRHSRETGKSIPSENAYELVDEHTGNRLSQCFLSEEYNKVLFPARPHSVRLEIEGNTSMELLLGAALAHAYRLCYANIPSRIYACCPPERNDLLNLLLNYGFRDTDGVVRMTKAFPAPALSPRSLPVGCVLVQDNLSDPTEQSYFLERYNTLFGTQSGKQWLREQRQKHGFTRYLAVASVGLVGEIILWQEPLVGVIGYIQTAKRWRRRGIASYLISVAEDYFSERGLYGVQTDVRARIPGMLSLMDSVGYHQEKLLMRYPNMDIS